MKTPQEEFETLDNYFQQSFSMEECQDFVLKQVKRIQNEAYITAMEEAYSIVMSDEIIYPGTEIKERIDMRKENS